MIVKHVELQDSIYVQTLTAEDYESLGFTQEEIDFGREYVRILNEQLLVDLEHK